MKLSRIRKKKMTWINLYVYGHLSYQYFGSKKPSYDKICNLEKILSLMQIDSLELYGVPLIPYKIYLEKDYLYIPYLSDLFRVELPESVKDDYYFLYDKVPKKYDYSKLLKKYSKLSFEDIDRRINEIHKSKYFNNKYFVVGKYTRQGMRRCARLQSSNKGWLVALSGFFGGIGIIFTLFILLKLVGINLLVYEWDDIFPALFFTYPLLFFSVLYGWKIANKKTMYEMELSKNFKNDNLV